MSRYYPTILKFYSDEEFSILIVFEHTTVLLSTFPIENVFNGVKFVSTI